MKRLKQMGKGRKGRETCCELQMETELMGERVLVTVQSSGLESCPRLMGSLTGSQEA